jgi:hypothetical protein
LHFVALSHKIAVSCALVQIAISSVTRRRKKSGQAIAAKQPKKELEHYGQDSDQPQHNYNNQIDEIEELH